MFPLNGNNGNNQGWGQNNNQLKWQQAINQNKPGGYPFDPYQVKLNDTFDSIATNTGFDVPSLQQANNGMLVPPPKGSYINVPKPVTQFYGPPRPQQQYVGQGTYIPQPAATPYGPQQTPAPAGPGVPTIGEGRGDPAMQALRQSFQQTAQQLATGQFPPSISQTIAGNIINPATGKPYTQQDYVAAGYTFNPATGSYTQPGAGGPGGGAGGGNSNFMNTGFMQQYTAQGTPFLQQKRWDPSTKKFVKIGDLVRQGKLNLRTGRFNARRRPEEQAAAPAPEATNTGTQPGQQLNTNVGGG